MTPFTAYKHYLATKLHFTTDYDVFESKGRTRASLESFNKRKDRFLFHGLSTRFVHDVDLIRYYVANFAYGNPQVIYNPELSKENYKEWLRRKESITKIFSDDLLKISSRCQAWVPIYASEKTIEDVRKEIISSIILEQILNNKISIESAVILNNLTKWIENTKTSIIYSEQQRLVTKLSRFVKYNEAKVQAVLQNSELSSLINSN